MNTRTEMSRAFGSPSSATRLLAVTVPLAGVLLLSACGSGSTGTSATHASPHSRRSAGANPVPASPGSPSPAARTPSQKPVPVESNPPGDIPDNLAFVRYSAPRLGFSFTHPEGWARTVTSGLVRFTDKLNGVTAESVAGTAAPTAASARSTEVPRLRQSVPAFSLRTVEAVSLPGGSGVRIVFRRNSDPNPVTGKVYRDEVEEYLVYGSGHLVRMDLYGPVGADNVDAYRTMSTSLRIR